MMMQEFLDLTALKDRAQSYYRSLISALLSIVDRLIRYYRAELDQFVHYLEIE